MFRVLLVDAKIQKHAQIAAVVSNFICNFTPTSTPTTIQPVMTINKTPRLWMSVLLMLMRVGTTTKPTGNSLCLLVDRPAIAQPNVDDQHKLCLWTRKQNL